VIRKLRADKLIAVIVSTILISSAFISPHQAAAKITQCNDMYGSYPSFLYSEELTSSGPTLIKASIVGNVDFVNAKIGKGFSFNQNGFVQVTDNQDLHHDYITISAWIKLNSKNPNNVGVIMNKVYGSTGSDGSFSLFESGGKLFGYVGTTTGKAIYVSGNLLPIGEFIHVAMVYDPSSSLTLYMGGKQVAATSLAGQDLADLHIKYDSHPINIGGMDPNEGSIDRRFNGIIDEPAFIAQRNQSPDEIKAIAENTIPICFDLEDDQIVSYYDKCPLETETYNGFEDDDGCPDTVPKPSQTTPPITDTDNDKIPDSVDKCISLAETINGFEDTDGCPDTVPATPAATSDKVAPLVIVPQNMVIPAGSSAGAAVQFSVKAVDDKDGIVSVTCDKTSGSMFPQGDTLVTCTATDKSGNKGTKSFTISVTEKLSIVIPTWAKDLGTFWCSDQIDANGFSKAIEYLIQNKIIVIPDTKSGTGTSKEVPGWVKSIACYWSQNVITDKEFVVAIQYLVENGIITT